MKRTLILQSYFPQGWDYTMQAETGAARTKPSHAQASIPAAWVMDYAHRLARK